MYSSFPLFEAESSTQSFVLKEAFLDVYISTQGIHKPYH